MSVNADHGQIRSTPNQVNLCPPMTKKNLFLAWTVTVSPAIILPQSVVLPLQVTVTITGGALESFDFTPGWQHTASIIPSVLGQAVPPGPLVQEKLVVKAVGVTATTLAPCRTAFLREFFVNQARENSAIPSKITRSRSSTNAVSINVCPFTFLLIIFRSHFLNKELNKKN
jgi:hypothetical protein